MRLVSVEISVDGGSFRLAAGTTRWSTPLDSTSLANGKHEIIARAIDGVGNTTGVSVFVTVANTPSDTKAPAVAITSPSSGQTVGGLVSIIGTASDDVALEKIELSIDGSAYRSAEGTSSWSYPLDTSAYADGEHIVAARATDVAGNVSSIAESLTVTNSEPPPTAPADLVPAPTMAPGTIGGFAFRELDRDGRYETDETPLASQRLYLFSGAGTFLRNAVTDAAGWFQFTGLSDGAYRVEYAPASWWELRSDWVPSTTASLAPSVDVVLAGTSRSDFGWRPVVRSRQAGSPISSYSGPNGLRVESYDDVVAAREIYDRVSTGSLIGREASQVVIRFDLASTGSTSSMAIGTNGVYTSYHATVDLSYLSWLDGDGELFHEYGHAWSLYYAHMAQQDPAMAAYLTARGLLGDARVGFLVRVGRQRTDCRGLSAALRLADRSRR